MKIYVISGKAKSGKNTFGNLIKEELKNYGYKPCVMHITEPLYSYARNYFEWNERTNEKPREFLQKMGIEIIKEKLGKQTFLIDRLIEDIEILSIFFDTFIITDARLKVELEKLKEKYADVKTIHIIRQNNDNDLSEAEKKHIPEIDLDDYRNFDYKILNTSIIDLKSKAKQLIITEEKGEKYE